MARLSIIETGLWDVPRNEIIAAETPEIYAENRRHKIPGYSVLIQDKKIGYILWDTGINADWEKEWSEQFKTDYKFDYLCSLPEELGKAGVTVNDIDLLIMSHLHYDHAGNIRMFKNTKAGLNIMVSEAEAKNAFTQVCMSPNGVSGPYYRNEFVMDGIGYQTINENMWLTDDIYLYIQVGHTPGVIGLLVRTEENGWMMFASDAVYSKLNFGPPIVLPGLCVDPENYKKNIAWLQQLREKYDAKMVFGHDVEDFKQWKVAPYWYE